MNETKWSAKVVGYQDALVKERFAYNRPWSIEMPWPNCFNGTGSTKGVPASSKEYSWSHCQSPMTRENQPKGQNEASREHTDQSKATPKESKAQPRAGLFLDVILNYRTSYKIQNRICTYMEKLNAD